MLKRGLSMLVIILIMIFLALIVVGVVWVFKHNDNTDLENLNESVITRSFSSSTIGPSGQIDVTLTITVLGDETYYAIEEYIPVGWTVIDDGGGATEEPDRLVWGVFGNMPLKDASITYTIQAPASPSNYIFDGIYMFEGDIAQTTTLGETTVIVS